MKKFNLTKLNWKLKPMLGEAGGEVPEGGHSLFPQGANLIFTGSISSLSCQ